MHLDSTEKEQLLEHAFTRIDVGIAILDEHRAVLLVNEAWRRLQSAHGGPNEGERYLDNRDATLVELDLDPKRFLVFITPTEARLNQRRVDSARFTAVATRDLQVPLRALNNLVLWLEEDLGDKPNSVVTEHLHHMRSRLAVLSKMVASLLRYTELEIQPTPPADVDVGTLLASLARTLERPPKLVLQIDDDMPTLHVSRPSLRQVFVELINNAITHHDTKEGVVRVRSQAMGTHWEFCIDDDGPGLHEVLLLFDNLDQRASAGPAGIGLALARRIVKEHGGDLRVDAREGRGATICFTWPKAPPR